METNTIAELYTPEHLERWSSRDPAFGSSNNYIGEDLSAFYVAPISQGRDTEDSVTLSNWRTISAELERVATHPNTGVSRFGHWAVGWYELFLIHESDTAALQCADRWASDLADDPVADESDLSELEHEQECEAWERYGEQEWREALENALEEYAPEDASIWWAQEAIEKLTDSELYDSWHRLTERCGWHCRHESDGPRFNIEGPAELLTVEELAKLTGLPLLAPEQEWRREPYPWPGSDPAPLEPPLSGGSDE